MLKIGHMGLAGLLLRFLVSSSWPPILSEHIIKPRHVEFGVVYKGEEKPLYKVSHV